MVLDLHVIQTDDGFTAEVPSIKGCESWAHSEDEAINKTIELLKYYLQSSSNQKIKIDRAAKNILLLFINLFLINDEKV